MSVKKVYLTEEGARVASFCQNNNVAVNFICFGLGSGENYNPSQATAMTDEKVTVPVLSCKRIESNHYKIRAEFSSEILDQDLVYRELCLYCQDPESTDKNVMYCYGNAKTDSEDYTEIIPAFTTTGNVSSRIVEIDIYVQGDSATYYIDNSAKADIATVQEIREELAQEIETRQSEVVILQEAIQREIETRQSRDNALETGIREAENRAKNLENATGTLAISNGGTGKTTAKDACNDLLNGLDGGNSVNEDTDTFISQYAGGQQNTFHRRPISTIWTYVQNKISSVLGLTASSYKGKASTAGTADTSKVSTTLFCSTADTTVAKTVTATGFSLVKGATVRVYFEQGNNVASPTLNVNGTGAKGIYVRNSQGSSATLSTAYGTGTYGAYKWNKNTILDLVYNGTYWLVIGNPLVYMTSGGGGSSTGGASGEYKIYINGNKILNGRTWSSNTVASKQKWDSSVSFGGISFSSEAYSVQVAMESNASVAGGEIGIYDITTSSFSFLLYNRNTETNIEKPVIHWTATGF